MSVVKVLIFLFSLSLVASSCSTSRGTSHRKSTARYHLKKKQNKRKYAATTTSSTGKYSSKPEVQAIRSAIVNDALSYLGTKYRYGGKSPNGFDCSGFTAYVLNKSGIDVRGSSRDQAKLGMRKSKKSLTAGDLVFFGSGSKVTHVGIVKENKGKELLVVHATSSKGVRTDDINGSDYWRQKFLFGRDVISN